jgi:SAM-dependent methyltransferase
LIDAQFDADFGVDTGGVQYLYDLTVSSANARFGTNHVASEPAVFASAMQRLDIDIASATFVDLGAGKGRVLILAAAYPFSAIVGVEFATELHKASVANINKAAGKLLRPERIKPLLADATDFDFPTGPLVLYLYNPFDAPVVAAVARNSFASWAKTPRTMRVVYHHPLFGIEWVNAGWLLLQEADGLAIFGPP